MLHIRRKAEIEVVCSASASILIQHVHEPFDDDSQALGHCAGEDDDIALDLDLDLDAMTLQQQQQHVPEPQAQLEPPDVTQTGAETLTGAPLLAAYLSYKINRAIDELQSPPGAEHVETVHTKEAEDHDYELVLDMEEFV